jgi:23S rRNA pseudouridine2605 synthase
MPDKTSQNKIEYPVKLVKFLSSAGVASRRKSFELIMKGEVKVNTAVNKEPSSLVNKDDVVTYKEKQIAIKESVYVMLNKPRGYTCTNDDPYAEKKAIDLINLSNYRLFSVGRLDKDSEGLILFTNDGDFSNTLMHPKHEITKTYIVTLIKELSFRSIMQLTGGIIDSGETLKALQVEKISKNKYKFILNEGKKREIRRLVKNVENNVETLRRVAVGNLKIENLPLGKWKYLSQNDLEKALGK